MKKLFKIIAICLALVGAFYLGHYCGVQDHKYGQIICDDRGTQGTYYSEYHGYVDEYYYE